MSSDFRGGGETNTLSLHRLKKENYSDEFWCRLLCLRVITFIKDDVKEANKHISEDYVHIIY